VTASGRFSSIIFSILTDLDEKNVLAFLLLCGVFGIHTIIAYGNRTMLTLRLLATRIICGATIFMLKHILHLLVQCGLSRWINGSSVASIVLSS